MVRLTTKITESIYIGYYSILQLQGEDKEKRSVLHGKLVRLVKQMAAVAAGVALVTLGVLVIRQVIRPKQSSRPRPMCRT